MRKKLLINLGVVLVSVLVICEVQVSGYIPRCSLPNNFGLTYVGVDESKSINSCDVERVVSDMRDLGYIHWPSKVGVYLLSDSELVSGSIDLAQAGSEREWKVIWQTAKAVFVGKVGGEYVVLVKADEDRDWSDWLYSLTHELTHVQQAIRSCDKTLGSGMLGEGEAMLVGRAVLIKYTNYEGRYQLQSRDLYKLMTSSFKTRLLLGTADLEIFKQKVVRQSYDPKVVDYDWVGLYAGFLATNSPNREKVALLDEYFKSLCGNENESVVFERVFGWSEESAWKKFTEWIFLGF